jgi:hypothetical protein
MRHGVPVTCHLPSLWLAFQFLVEEVPQQCLASSAHLIDFLSSSAPVPRGASNSLLTASMRDPVREMQANLKCMLIRGGYSQRHCDQG